MNKSEHSIDIQYAINADTLPGPDDIRCWAETALLETTQATELVIRVVDEVEMTALNHRYRGKDGPTNVLSFPAEPHPEMASNLLGDVVICAPVIAQESVTQQKTPEAHWAHLVIHGVLHLLGYDHDTDEQAQRMESCEARLLEALGINDPYQEMA